MPSWWKQKKILLLILFILAILILSIFALIPRSSKQNQKSSNGSASSCPDPLVLQSPVDLNEVTSILYPGQKRGGDYKPHGGFRFDNAPSNEVEVRAPYDGTLTDASRYIEVGEVQYLLDFQTPCAVRYRFDHILELSPKLAVLNQELPEAKENDSRTTRVRKKIEVKKGEVIATAIGVKENRNVFVDFGVFKSGGLFSNPKANPLCFFDLLSSDDATKVKSLPPADSTSGSQSDLCQL